MSNERETTCDYCCERLEEFALESLPTDETAAVAEHLQSGCLVCNRRLAELAGMFALTTHTAQTQLPPLNLERQLMRRIAGQAEPARAPVDTTPARTQVSSPRQLIAAVITLAATLLGIAAWSTWHRDRSIEEGVATSLPAALEQRIHHADQSDPFSASPRLEFAYLSEPPLETRVHGYTVIDQVANQWHVYVINLPPAAADRKYQAWLVSGEQYVPVGQLDVDSDGSAALVLDVPTSGATATGIAISDEPSETPQSPTGKNFFRAALR